MSQERSNVVSFLISLKNGFGLWKKIDSSLSVSQQLRYATLIKTGFLRLLKSSVLKGKRSSFFLLVFGSIFLVFYATNFSLPTEKDPIQFYSTHLRDDLRLITLKTIEKAEKSIHVYTYALTDPDVLSALIKKARSGVSVHITYHQKNTPKLKSLPYLHLHPKTGSGLMHAKWMIIDETLILLGTANLTSSSLTMHENFLMGLHAPDFAKNLIIPSSYQGSIGNQILTFYWLPDQAGLDYLLARLNEATKTVNIALFTLTHPIIVKKLTDLHNRGVSIRLILDQSVARGASKKAANTLLKTGISVGINQGLPLFHHKWALIDTSTFVLGSANWTQAAFKKNKDFILFLSPLTWSQKKYLHQMINIIKKESFEYKNV